MWATIPPVLLRFVLLKTRGTDDRPQARPAQIRSCSPQGRRDAARAPPADLPLAAGSDQETLARRADVLHAEARLRDVFQQSPRRRPRGGVAAGGSRCAGRSGRGSAADLLHASVCRSIRLDRGRDVADRRRLARLPDSRGVSAHGGEGSRARCAKIRKTPTESVTTPNRRDRGRDAPVEANAVTVEAPDGTRARREACNRARRPAVLFRECRRPAEYPRIGVTMASC